MTLKFELDNLDGLDDAIKSLYKAGDNGKFRLDVDDTGYKSALDKERAERKALEKAVKDGTLQQSELQAKLQELEDERLKAEGKTQELAAKQAERMKADFEKRELEIKAQLEMSNKRALAFENQVFENQFRATGSKMADFHEHAIDDAILRAKALFKLNENGIASAVDSDGNAVYGKDGKTPLTPQEWLDGMRDTAPHWFKAQSGSGTSGGGSGTSAKTLADCKTDAEKIAYLQAQQK